MDKKTKLILSVIGVAAIVVPAILLLILSSKNAAVPSVSQEARQIDTQNVADTAAKSIPSPTPVPSPSPTPTPTPAASPEATGSAQ